jgi:hypothetical protein
LSEISHPQLKEVFSRASMSDAVRGDLRFLLEVGTLWGPESLSSFRFTDGLHDHGSSRFSGFLQGFRH